MSGIVVDPANPGRHVDILSLDANGFRSFFEESSERAASLKTDQKHRRAAIP